jgi:hypothetical protein
MKYYHVFFTIALLLFTSIADANITSWTCDDNGDGSIVINADFFSGMLLINGTQYSYPGYIQGSFTTDTEVDPVVWIVESLNNQTNFAWTDYHIDIGMNKPFSIVGVVSPFDWTWAITPPTGGQQLPNQAPGTLGWLGIIDYYAGTPISIGASDSFGLVISFTGSAQFYIEQVPTGIIPAPGSSLLGGIGIGCARWLRRRKSLYPKVTSCVS